MECSTTPLLSKCLDEQALLVLAILIVDKEVGFSYTCGEERNDR
jgi:hypothetical protein